MNFRIGSAYFKKSETSPGEEQSRIRHVEAKEGENFPSFRQKIVGEIHQIANDFQNDPIQKF